MQANNNQVVLLSEMYTSKQAAEKGIESIKKEAASAEVVDETKASQEKSNKVHFYKE